MKFRRLPARFTAALLLAAALLLLCASVAAAQTAELRIESADVQYVLNDPGMSIRLELQVAVPQGSEPIEELFFNAPVNVISGGARLLIDDNALGSVSVPRYQPQRVEAALDPGDLAPGSRHRLTLLLDVDYVIESDQQNTELMSVILKPPFPGGVELLGPSDLHSTIVL
ncbi:MAG: hypothetical protein P9M14_15270, partial [Candidatus Alcyoniella australis]|nr:hypothetical protein [Candidatus Alcyoniella australis]